jgi:hypothetical protein
MPTIVMVTVVQNAVSPDAVGTATSMKEKPSAGEEAERLEAERIAAHRAAVSGLNGGPPEE